jgi:hypothetical protein
LFLILNFSLQPFLFTIASKRSEYKIAFFYWGVQVKGSQAKLGVIFMTLGVAQRVWLALLLRYGGKFAARPLLPFLQKQRLPLRRGQHKRYV